MYMRFISADFLYQERKENNSLVSFLIGTLNSKDSFKPRPSPHLKQQQQQQQQQQQ